MRRSPAGRAATVAAAALLVASSAGADMGMVLPVADVTVHEPGQKAIIAHDGFEEILILATDLEATAETVVLRFIPLPAEPVVSAAPPDCFERLEEIIDRHGLDYLVQMRSKDGGIQGEAVELLSHQRIGAHDVTVVRIRDVEHFGRWVDGFLKERGLPSRALNSEERAIVGDYVERGFPYFVFDIVEVGPETETVSPLVYRFESRRFYYPLAATNLFGGEGRIDLFVFSDRGDLLKSLYYAPWRCDGDVGPRGWLPSSTAIVSSEEMESVAPEIAGLLGARAVLGAFRYQGRFRFDCDIVREIPIREMKASSGLRYGE